MKHNGLSIELQGHASSNFGIHIPFDFACSIIVPWNLRCTIIYAFPVVLLYDLLGGKGVGEIGWCPKNLTSNIREAHKSR